jgi:CHAD domain-containing protein
MAGARRIPGLNPNDSYATAAAMIVGVRARELIDRGDGILDVGDIERVHDMRVATRRLRAALELFEPCFPRRELKAGIRQVKALADALGERRDRDVAIAALEDIAAAMSAPDRTGIETLIGRLRAEQKDANESVARLVSADRLASLGELLSDLAASAELSPPADDQARIKGGEHDVGANGAGGGLSTRADEDAA